MNDDVFINRIALTLIDGIGDILIRQLISYCGSVEGVFREKQRILQKIPDIGPKTAASIANFKGFDQAAKEYLFVQKNNIKMFFYMDENFPHRLKNCYDAPVLLYYKGKADLNHKRTVAIVGTRKATFYGKKFTKDFIDELSELNVVVVSGLAYGIDITAHKACLDAAVPTIGVLAHGLDKIYPGSHFNIANIMTETGGLITEHVSGADPDRENFPKRNRIIAGLSDAVIVVEAAGKGGALITADIANSYNRDVFAVPGRINDVYSAGCNSLIKMNKAVLLQSAKDIKYIMGWDDDHKQTPVQTQLFRKLNEEEQLLFDIIEKRNKLPVDEIYIQSGLMQSKVAAILLNMEFSGIVRCLPGKIYEIAG